MLIIPKEPWCLSSQKGPDSYHPKRIMMLITPKGHNTYHPKTSLILILPRSHDGYHVKKVIMLIMSNDPYTHQSYLSSSKGHSAYLPQKGLDTYHPKWVMVHIISNGPDTYHPKRVMMFIIPKGPWYSLSQSDIAICKMVLYKYCHIYMSTWILWPIKSHKMLGSYHKC